MINTFFDDIPHIKPLTKTELEIAIDSFCKSGDEYPDPPSQGLREHIFPVEEEFVEVSFPFICEKCKRVCFDRQNVRKEDLYEPSDYQKFQTIAARYRYAGYDAHVYFYCDDCLAEEEYPERVAFSFKTEGMEEPVISREIFTFFTKQYELALRFLLGKRTVIELAKDDVNSGSPELWNAKAYISAIARVLKTGIHDDPVECEVRELFRHAKPKEEDQE